MSRHESTPSGRRQPSLTFLGGARTVTGSKFLVESDGRRVLVDCGLFQGLRALRELNWADPPVDPASIDAIVVSHAHVDHLGYLPRLVAHGFDGAVHATTATCELAGVVLPDCAHLLEEEAAYANRIGSSRHRPAHPLYSADDATRSVAMLRPVPFGQRREVTAGITAELLPAGHILGSASVRLTLGAAGTTVGFSGDLGRPNHPLLVPPVPLGAVDTLVVESTYGDRRHDAGDPAEQLADVVGRTVARGGSVVLPAFAVDRTEVVLHHLARLAAEGRLPDVPVYVDSPMALAALQVYRAASMRGDADLRERCLGDAPVFDVPRLHEVHDVGSSKALNRPGSPSIIISASGMASGGRVVHHLAHLLPDARNTVALVGYQAAGTRGRRLLEGERELKMLGQYVRVRAEIANLTSFSVHADADELLAWATAAPEEPDAVYVVHGEPAASAALVGAVGRRLDCSVVAPRLDERVLLGRRG